MARFRCPGSDWAKEPKPECVDCPACGNEVEIWSDEFKRVCERCQKIVTKEAVPSCAEWCPKAEECLGTELYSKLMESKSESA